MADLDIEIRARKVKCDQSTLPINELTEVCSMAYVKILSVLDNVNVY